MKKKRGELKGIDQMLALGMATPLSTQQMDGSTPLSTQMDQSEDGLMASPPFPVGQPQEGMGQPLGELDKIMQLDQSLAEMMEMDQSIDETQMDESKNDMDTSKNDMDTSKDDTNESKETFDESNDGIDDMDSNSIRETQMEQLAGEIGLNKSVGL